jgi:hypothetical protein
MKLKIQNKICVVKQNEITQNKIILKQEWQQAFENASISPSDMWDKIEQLERKNADLLFILRPSAIASA